MRSEPMVVQAARLAFFGVLLAAIGLTARAPAAPATVPADSFPVATDARLRGSSSTSRAKSTCTFLPLPILTGSSSTFRRLRFDYRLRLARPVAA